MTTYISIVSQKGGVGKTTTAVNLATCFAIGGFNTLLLDLDPQGSIRFSFGIQNPVQIGSKELFLSSEFNPEMIHRTHTHKNLSFIFSNIDTISEERETNRRAMAFDLLYNSLADNVKEFDIVIIDAPASTSNIALNALYCGDLIILPIQCENLAIKSMKRFLSTFQEFQYKVKDKEIRLAGILLTMFDKNIQIHRRIAKQLFNALSDCVFQTMIPHHESILNSSVHGRSVLVHNLNSIGSIAYIHLMNELIERHQEYFDLDSLA